MVSTCVAVLSILAWCDVTGGSVVAVLERGDFHAIVFHAVSKQAVECLGGNRQQEVEIGSAVEILTNYTSDIYTISIY